MSTLISWFTDAAAGMGEAVSNGAATVISYLIAAVVVRVTAWLSLLPEVPWPCDESDIAEMVSVAFAWNDFVPIVEGMGMFGLCVGFIFFWGWGRFFLALIPGIR